MLVVEHESFLQRGSSGRAVMDESEQFNVSHLGREGITAIWVDSKFRFLQRGSLAGNALRLSQTLQLISSHWGSSGSALSAVQPSQLSVLQRGRAGRASRKKR